MSVLSTSTDSMVSTLRRAMKQGQAWPWLAGATALIAVLAWSYGPMFIALARRWYRDPDYTHGFLVVPFAVLLLWSRREMVAEVSPRGTLWGFALLALAGVMRWASAYYSFVLLNSASLLPCAAGLVLLMGGWRWLWWAAPSIVFLGFMFPLPGFATGYLSQPLQHAGTIVATYLLQLIGIPAASEGNLILLTDAQLGVVEACSGLKMMVMFFAVCIAVAFLVKRPLLDRILIVSSAVPIALLANVFRLIITGVLHEYVGGRTADTFFHDLAGWFMMPAAMILLGIELLLLSRLLVIPQRAAAASIASVGVEVPNKVGGRRAKQTARRK
jgi:exosortase